VAIMIGAAPHWGKAAAAFTTSVPVFPLSILVAIMLAVGLKIDLRRSSHLTLCAVGLICALSLRLPGGPLGPEHRKWVHVQPWLMVTGKEEVIANWCRNHLPQEERLLVPPDSAAFRLHAERPVVVDYKCFPFSPADVIEWRRRMLDVCGLPYETRLREKSMRDLVWAYEQRSAPEILALGRKYDARFFVTRSDRDYPSFVLMQQYLKWRVYRLPKAAAGKADSG
jgi:hypothetical protein